MYAEFKTKAGLEDIDLLLEVEKLAWDTPGENISASREKISRRIPKEEGTESVVLATMHGEPAGSQYAFRFDWSFHKSTLTSWDEHTKCGWTHLVHRPNGNTGFLVGVGVVPQFRGIRVDHALRWQGQYKIAELLIAVTLDNLFSPANGQGVQCVIANARIPFYHKRAELSVEDYCALRREDGELFDPVLRFHERMGAKLIKPVVFSMEDTESLNGGCWVMYLSPFNGF